MNKKCFYTELAYVFGLIFVAIGTALMKKADLGMSMVVAPAFVLHLKMIEFFPKLSFGTMLYIYEGAIVLMTALVMRKFKLSYLFSFVTAVIYGWLADAAIYIFSPLNASGMPVRIIVFLIGMVSCSMGVALMFNTYFSPEAFELFIKEISARFKLDIFKTKTWYDCISCLLGVVLSFVFFGFGHFEGVKLGTVFCALVNGWLIGRSSKAFNHFFEFKDGLKLRKYFQ